MNYKKKQRRIFCMVGRSQITKLQMYPKNIEIKNKINRVV